MYKYVPVWESSRHRYRSSIYLLSWQNMLAYHGESSHTIQTSSAWSKDWNISTILLRISRYGTVDCHSNDWYRNRKSESFVRLEIPAWGVRVAIDIYKEIFECMRSEEWSSIWGNTKSKSKLIRVVTRNAARLLPMSGSGRAALALTAVPSRLNVVRRHAG